MLVVGDVKEKKKKNRYSIPMKVVKVKNSRYLQCKRDPVKIRWSIHVNR